MADNRDKLRSTQFGEYTVLIVLAVLVVLAMAKGVDWRTLLLIVAGL